MDQHKAIIVVDSEGRALGYSAEEMLTLGISKWKGWRCSAGKENLYINADGNVFSATCKVGGWMGNIYDAHLVIPEQWIECTKNACTCGADMQLRKSKSLEYRNETYKQPPPESAQAPVNPVWVAPYHWEHHQKYPLNISWDLGRRCNFKCSYCHPSISNQYEAFRSWGSLKDAADHLIRWFCEETLLDGTRMKPGRKAKWVFTGGEPTLNPSFLDLARFLKGQGHLLHTQSNGSRGGEYFSELIDFSCVGLSYHFESANMERFLDTCRAIVEKKKANREARLHWFGVRIMVLPGRVEEAVALRERLLGIPDFTQMADLAMSPLYEKMKQEKLLEYRSEETDTILRFS